MGIMLGNLTVEQMEQRLEIKLTDEERETMRSSRQEKANDIAPDKWHCFDMPFMIACGSKEMQSDIINILQPYSSSMKEALQIGVTE